MWGHAKKENPVVPCQCTELDVSDTRCTTLARLFACLQTSCPCVSLSQCTGLPVCISPAPGTRTRARTPGAVSRCDLGPNSMACSLLREGAFADSSTCAALQSLAYLSPRSAAGLRHCPASLSGSARHPTQSARLAGSQALCASAKAMACGDPNPAGLPGQVRVGGALTPF